MRGLLLATVLGLAACAAPQSPSQIAQIQVNQAIGRVCPGPHDDAYYACYGRHPELVQAQKSVYAQRSAEVDARPVSTNPLTIDQMENAWDRADARSDYNRLWQPHYGYSSGYNPVAP
jgi:hypothetical protein